MPVDDEFNSIRRQTFFLKKIANEFKNEFKHKFKNGFEAIFGKILKKPAGPPASSSVRCLRVAQCIYDRSACAIRAESAWSRTTDRASAGLLIYSPNAQMTDILSIYSPASVLQNARASEFLPA